MKLQYMFKSNTAYLPGVDKNGNEKLFEGVIYKQRLWYRAYLYIKKVIYDEVKELKQLPQ